MWMIRLAWKNLWRNRSCTLITLAALFFAVILSTLAAALKEGIFNNLVQNVVSFYTGSIQIHKRGYQAEQILDNGFIRSKALETALVKNPDIRVMTPRLESFALISSAERTKGCMIAGIDPEQEDRVTQLRNKLVKGRYLNKQDASVLLAEGLARRLMLSVGDTIVLIGQGYHGATAAGKYPVTGILHFGSPQLNERLLYMPLPLAQELFSAPNLLTSYVLSLPPEKEPEELVETLQKRAGPDLEVLTWGELLPDIKQHIDTDSGNMRVVQSILYLLICFGLFSTMLMMLLERRYEMGMLIAIGMKKSRLMALFLFESILTVLIGCAIGMLASVPLITYLHRYPIRIGGDTAKAYERFGFEAIFPTDTAPWIFLYQALIVLIIGVLLSLYPIWRVWRLDPVTAMKT